MTDYSKKTASQLKISISMLKHQTTVSEIIIKDHECKLTELAANLARAEKALAEKEAEATRRDAERKSRDDFLMREVILKTEYRKKREEQARDALRHQPEFGFGQPAPAFGGHPAPAQQPEFGFGRATIMTPQEFASALRGFGQARKLMDL
jgi:hypothetical protein